YRDRAARYPIARGWRRRCARVLGSYRWAYAPTRLQQYRTALTQRDVSRALPHERQQRRVLQAIRCGPFTRLLERCSIVGGDGRFEQNAQIGRLFLRLPVFSRELQRCPRIADDGQGEARLFALVERITATARSIEARREIRPVCLERRAHLRQSLRSKCKSQQQIIVLGGILDERHDVCRAVAVEQEIGVR